MIRALRPAAIAAAALALSSCAQLSGVLDSLPKLPSFSSPKAAPPAEAPATSVPASAAPAELAPGQWPQAASDLAAAPEVRFGALPNGMRYAIQKNATPPGQASLRLRFDAGSLMETDEQQGLAHFLEHMAFNGSKAIPEGEMVKILERHGLAFGADTNASTSWTETVYKLDLPQTDPAIVDDSLKILRQTASELTIAADAVDRERGVVLSEERTRDSPAYRIFKQRLDFFMRGQRPPQRYPIGDTEVLKNAPRDLIADFYGKYYRPERAVLVAVGDFDVDVMEAKIRQTFADWTDERPAGPQPELGKVARRGAEALVAVEPGAQLGLQIAWVSPPDRSPDTADWRKRQWIERLGFSVLNRRLEQLARGAEPPFIAAAGFRGNQFLAAGVTTLAVTARAGAWEAALSAVEREQRRAVKYGVRQDELDREIAEIRASLEAQVAQAATRRTPALASEIVGTLEEDRIVTSPAQDLALFEAAVKDLKAETVSATFKAAFEGSGPLVFVATPEPIDGGEAAVLAALKASRQVAVTPPEAPRQMVWPYAAFGAPSKVVETREVTDLDTVFVRFENGVRLTVKTTKFRDDQVMVRVNIGRGQMSLPTDRQSAAWAANAVIEGGLEKITAEDMERVLAAKVYGAEFGVDDEAFVLSGSTRSDDLPTQMQVLAAYASEAAWRAEAFERLKGYVATLHDQYEATDSGVFGRDLAGLLHGDDPRWTFPTRQETAAATLSDLKAQVGAPLASGPIEVVIVGDITVEKAIDATAMTFAALPPRPEPAALSEAEKTTGFPAPGGPVTRTHSGRADQAIGYIAWRTDDFFSDPQMARATAVMGEVFELRLIDEIREAQGIGYSPQVRYLHSQAWPDWGYVSAQVEAPPDKLDGFFADARQIAADLAAAPPTADEMERAKKPRLEKLEKARQTNDYWLSELSGAQGEPRKLDAIRALLGGTERVTAADVQAAAARYLGEGKAWTFVVRPRGQ